VNSVVGFGVVGGGVAYALQGAIRNKVAWLVLGMAFVWLLNLLRIELIFLVGALFGQAAALDVFHPIAGLIVFNLAILAMLFVAPRFGLGYPAFAASPDGPLRNASPVRKVRPALAVAVAIAVALGAVNAGYARFQAVAGVMGDAQLARFDPATSRIDGWSARHVADYSHGRPFFGATSSWQRLVYRGEPTAGLRADVPLYVDLIDTSEADKLAAFSVEACYNFHGFGIDDQGSRQLGRGVVATIINYTRPKSGSRWSALWWEWPYRSGDGTRFERVVLLVPDGPNATYEGLSADVEPLTSDFDFADTERFLVTVATAMLDGHFDALESRTAGARP
jgi:exosortase/archaeosortase family protein